MNTPFGEEPDAVTVPVFDAHCDTLSRMARLPGRHLDAHTGQWDLERMSAFTGPKAQFFAVFALLDRRRAVERQISLFRLECARRADQIAHCRSGTEADRAIAAHKLCAFLSVEGGELLDCSLERLQWAYDQGVRAVNLTWNHANALSGSHQEEPDRGLSERGKAFVGKMNELGMLIDVSHLSDAGFWDVAALTERPFIASHSNSRSVFFHTRNLTDAQFTAIIERHGIVGLNCYAAFLGNRPVTMDTLRRHLEHFLSLGGEKTVALGGDWDGCSKLPEGFRGAWNWLDFYEYLLRKNYPEALLRDLYFDNLMRTVREVCTI